MQTRNDWFFFFFIVTLIVQRQERLNVNYFKQSWSILFDTIQSFIITKLDKS